MKEPQTTNDAEKIAAECMRSILAYIDAEVMGDFQDYASKADLSNIKNIIYNSICSYGGGYLVEG